MVRKKGTIPRCKSFDRRTDAVAWAAQLEAEANRAGMVGDASLPHRVTLGDVMLRYRDQRSPNKRGARSEQARLTAMARRSIAQCTLAKLTSSQIATYRDERLQEVAPATVLRELSLMRTALEVATTEWGIPLPHNPVAPVRRPTVRNERSRRVHRDEEARLLEACEAGRRSNWMKPILILAIETAMRRSEMLALTWADADLINRTAYVRRSKNGDARDIPLSRRAVKALQGVRRLQVDRGAFESSCGDFESEHGRFVFSFTASAIRLAFERIRTRARCSNLHFHDLRREAVTRFIERGLNLIEAAHISGHRDVRMLRRYVVPQVSTLLVKLDARDPSPA